MKSEIQAGIELRKRNERPLKRFVDTIRKKRNSLSLIIILLGVSLLKLLGAPLSTSNAQQFLPGAYVASAASSISGKITVLSDIAEGNGTYFEPYVINSDTVEWRVDIEGTNKENALYKVDVHMEHYRSCATVKRWDDLSLDDIQARGGIFQYTTEMAGWYYLRIDVNEDGQYRELFDERVHIFFRVPPINPYTLPYSPPPTNLKPIPKAEILNGISGTGVYTDPILIDSPIVEFRIDQTQDPNGIQDLMNGVFLWAIHMQGHHPVYAKEQGTRNAQESFLYYPEIEGITFTWDTRERPSEDGHYTLHIPVIDQHGDWDETKLIFQISDSCNCTAWQDRGCGGGTCPAGEMYQVRNCTPGGCSLEARCIQHPICSSTYEMEDINQDGKVDALDLELEVSVFLGLERRPEITRRADVNGDGKVDTQDIQQIVNKQSQ